VSDSACRSDEKDRDRGGATAVNPRAREPNNVALDTTATPNKIEAYCGLLMVVVETRNYWIDGPINRRLTDENDVMTYFDQSANLIHDIAHKFKFWFVLFWHEWNRDCLRHDCTILHLEHDVGLGQEIRRL
jgi:hypothetical protein